MKCQTLVVYVDMESLFTQRVRKYGYTIEAVKLGLLTWFLRHLLGRVLKEWSAVTMTMTSQTTS